MDDDLRNVFINRIIYIVYNLIHFEFNVMIKKVSK